MWLIKIEHLTWSQHKNEIWRAEKKSHKCRNRSKSTSRLSPQRSAAPHLFCFILISILSSVQRARAWFPQVCVQCSRVVAPPHPPPPCLFHNEHPLPCAPHPPCFPLPRRISRTSGCPRKSSLPPMSGLRPQIGCSYPRLLSSSRASSHPTVRSV